MKLILKGIIDFVATTCIIVLLTTCLLLSQFTIIYSAQQTYFSKKMLQNDDSISLSIITSTPPQVINYTPTGIIPISYPSIWINFSAEMNHTESENGFTLSPWTTGGSFEWNITSPGNETLKYVFSGVLPYSTTFTVTLNSNIVMSLVTMDFLDGNANGVPEGSPIDDVTWQFTTEADTIPPTVNGHAPTGTNVPVQSEIAVHFSEYINTTSFFNAFNITPPVAGSFNYYDYDNFTFTPDSNLALNTTYTVTLNASILKDSNGVYLDSNGNGVPQGSPLDDYKWNFTTANKVDMTPPKVSNYNPKVATTSITATISVQFSEAMNGTSLTSCFNITPYISGSLLISFSSLVYYPSQNLPTGTMFTVIINGSLAMDLANYTLDGNGNGISEGSPVDDFTWQFTTQSADTYPPFVTGTMPGIVANVDVNTNVTISFTERMNETGLSSAFTIMPFVTGSFIYVDAIYNIYLKFNPDNPLNYNTTYTIKLNGSIAKDQAGNLLDGNINHISEGSPIDDYSWQFTTKVSTLDTTPPVSNVIPSTPYWRTTTPMTIEAMASDADSIVSFVALYCRYRVNNVSSWSLYQLFGTNDTTAPYQWSFTWPNGQGVYEFYTRATDNASNLEAAPGVADAGWAYDTTAGTQTISAIAPYWKTASPVTVTANPTDTLSGVKNVALYYRFRASNTSAWGAWTLFGTNDTVTPYQWSFSMPGGEGVYDFVTRVTDVAGNIETMPAIAEEDLGYDFTTPASTSTPAAEYWQSSNPFTINATATDSVSGILNVGLYYRYRPDNASAWTSFLHFGVNDTVAPYQWSFNWFNGQGIYEFYTRATDNALNTEAAPAVKDSGLAYDATAPSSNAIKNNPYRRNTSKMNIVSNVSGDLSGVAQVALYYRYRIDNATTFGAWTRFGTNETAAPYNWTFNWPVGQGVYEFYTRAVDNVSNIEAAPVSADAGWQYDSVPPRVFSISPTGLLNPLNSIVAITFNESMNKSSVENSFSITPVVTGSFSWNGDTFRFTPSAALLNSVMYSVKFTGTAKDLAGNTLDGNSNGVAQGSPSDDVSWTFTTVPDTTAPAAITNLAVTLNPNGSVNLTWTAPGDDGSVGTATSYDIRYSTVPINATNWANATNATGEPTPGVAGTAQKMSIAGLAEGFTYYFAIVASDEVPNDSPLSNVVNVTLASPTDTTPPATPTGVQAVAETTGIRVTWTAVSDADLNHYAIYRSTNNATFTLVTNVTSGTSYLDTNVVNGTTYYYKLTATDDSENESPFSTTTKAAWTVEIVTPPPTTPKDYTLIIAIVVIGALVGVFVAYKLFKGRKGPKEE
jgi:hypothetical protein